MSPVPPLPTAQCVRIAPLANCPCQHTDGTAHSPPQAALLPQSSCLTLGDPPQDSIALTLGDPLRDSLALTLGEPPPGQHRSDARHSLAASLPKAEPVCMRARPLCIMRLHRFCLRSFQQPPPSSILGCPAGSPGAASPSLEGAGHAPPPQALVTALLDSLQKDSSSVRSAPSKKREGQVVPEEPHWGGEGRGLSALRSPAPQSTAPSVEQDSVRGGRQREFQRVMPPPRITKRAFCMHTSNRLFSEAFISGTLGIDFG